MVKVYYNFKEDLGSIFEKNVGWKSKFDYA